MKRNSKTITFQCLLLAGLLIGSSRSMAQVDLHAHLHMKPGMGFLLNGSANEEPKSGDWTSRMSTKATLKSLAESKVENQPPLIVIALYAHPYFSYSFSHHGFHFDRQFIVKETLNREYLEFKSFMDSNSDRYGFAKTPHEARKIIDAGKTAILLSIEGAFGALESEEDYQLWIDERGLSILTPVHLTPDHFGGNSLMLVIQSLLGSTYDFLESVLKSRGECLKTFCKSHNGFTSQGEKLIKDMIQRNVWIDFSHMNEIQVSWTARQYEQGHSGSGSLPMMITHSQFREFNPMERSIGELEINYILKNDGVVGITPAQQMLREAYRQARIKAEKTGECVSSLDLFRMTMNHAFKVFQKPERIFLASDVNAPVDGLSPSCDDKLKNQSSESVKNLKTTGFYRFHQWNALAEFIETEIPNNSGWNRKNLVHLLKQWEKIRPSKNPERPNASVHR